MKFYKLVLFALLAVSAAFFQIQQSYAQASPALGPGQCYSDSDCQKQTGLSCNESESGGGQNQIGECYPIAVNCVDIGVGGPGIGFCRLNCMPICYGNAAGTVTCNSCGNSRTCTVLPTNTPTPTTPTSSPRPTNTPTPTSSVCVAPDQVTNIRVTCPYCQPQVSGGPTPFVSLLPTPKLSPTTNPTITQAPTVTIEPTPTTVPINQTQACRFLGGVCELKTQCTGTKHVGCSGVGVTCCIGGQ